LCILPALHFFHLLRLAATSWGLLAYLILYPLLQFIGFALLDLAQNYIRLAGPAALLLRSRFRDLSETCTPCESSAIQEIRPKTQKPFTMSINHRFRILILFSIWRNGEDSKWALVIVESPIFMGDPAHVEFPGRPELNF
jgi:hypothetical protein